MFNHSAALLTVSSILQIPTKPDTISSS